VSIAVAHHAPEVDAALLHDVRNSLAALRLLVEGLRDGVVAATPDSGTLEQMMLHVRLLSDLLDEQTHARETRWGAASGQPLRIGPFLKQWSDAMRPKAEQRQIDLRLAVAHGLPDVACRRGQVARVVLNLIDNAIRHSPAGGTVVVRAVAHPGGVQVQINDTGPGLPEGSRGAPLDAVWPTQPGRPGRRGLVIARTIVERHGGALWATSLPRGASVRFYLPTIARVGA
jgi:signal transduction histidine kinase